MAEKEWDWLDSLAAETRWVFWWGRPTRSGEITLSHERYLADPMRMDWRNAAQHAYHEGYTR